MLKTPVLILLLLVTAIFAQGQTRRSAWLNGTWEGTGYQSDSNSTWTMKLTARRNRYVIEYPSLKCGGRWRPLSINQQRAIFREVISYGIEACTDQGRVVIERLSDRQIAYRYSNAGTSLITASAILNRVRSRR